MNKEKLDKIFIFSAKNWGLFFLWMFGTSIVCYLLQQVVDSDVHVPLIFVLAVFLTSLTTEGYFYGALASVFSVFAVNWAFTYPYMKIDFSIYGYPITFVTMLTVGIATSTLTTALKRQDQLKIQAQKEQVRANLLRSISHDIKTPLTVIMGDLEMMENSDDPKLMQDAKENVQWLKRMIENVLSITRFGDTPAEITTTDEVPDEIIEDVIKKFRNYYPGVKIKTELPDEVFTVPVDAVLIEQLFLNLLENAVKHGKATEITIKLEKYKEYALFSVSDNGHGIDEKLIAHLFDGSLQLDSINAGDNNKYMGIGLMVCKTIVTAHGGNISAHNNDRGAEFDFTLQI